jgi:hypothetical protein
MRKTMQTLADKEEQTHIPSEPVVRTHYLGEGHVMTPLCWCFPRLDFKDPETGNEVWVHHQPC